MRISIQTPHLTRCRVRTHFSRSNSSTFQALLRVIYKIYQHLIAGVKYFSSHDYFFSLFITIMYIVLCCKHLKWCFMIAKTLEIKGEHKVLSKKREATWCSAGTLAPGQRETWEHPVIFFFDINFYKLFAYSSSVLILNVSSVQIASNSPSPQPSFSIATRLHVWWYTHTLILFLLVIRKLSSLIPMLPRHSYNVKHFQALKLKSKHFSDLENTTLKFKHFQGFQAPVRTLNIYIYTYMHIFTK